MDLNEHILRKELINMRESMLSDWREELTEEEHPYVDVMPSSEESQDKPKKKKKKEKEEDKEEVKEETEISEARAKTREEARAKLDAHSKAMKGEGESPYFKNKELKKVKFNGDPWSAHSSDAKAHSKEDKIESPKRPKLDLGR